MTDHNIIDFVNAYIEGEAASFTSLSDQVWEFAETRFEEHASAELLAEHLEQQGFSVEREAGGIETAFVASYGQGKPVIALLGEYDALAGLSQQGGCAHASCVTENGNGHGCGHNLLGVAALSGVLAVKEYMDRNKLQGTIRFYGCPGEEGGSGKTFMVREGLFDDVDAALTWHPGTFSGIFSQPTLANIQAEFSFKGISSHAAASPHLGRSALDAVELMNVGTNYLREHVIQEARIHYAITNAGGDAPNVVQANASVLYLIRAPKISDAQAIYDRVVKIAEGAGMMTETELTVRFDKACSNFVPNRHLERLMYQHMRALGLPDYSDEEQAFAAQIRETLNESDVASDYKLIANMAGLKGNEFVKSLDGKVLMDEVAPYEPTSSLLSGSTDVGDVSWVVPTAQCFSPCFAIGTQFHTWQVVSQVQTSIGHKGMLLASKAMAATAIDLLLDPKHCEISQQELADYTRTDNYSCPIPDSVSPSRLG
ncbi:M20 family metallopeptidase [Zobellella maritima]|uniref:M20 family metallopeptidase n=1 Tax=Zobellella maritima TaxID=2059725 RepID=UPI000E300D1A|nr:M20 family metallopeptidase [Zobellella maritima]